MLTEDCPVCLEEVTAGGYTACGHFMCTDHFKVLEICPLCREDLVVPIQNGQIEAHLAFGCSAARIIRLEKSRTCYITRKKLLAERALHDRQHNKHCWGGYAVDALTMDELESFDAPVVDLHGDQYEKYDDDWFEEIDYCE